MKNYDVVVIGAGLAGLQVARLLGEHGAHVLLVDQKSALDKSIHTTGIFVRRTFEDFDLPADCLGPPVRHVTLYSPARRSMDLVSPFDEFRVGRMGLLYEKFLNRAMSAGAEWMPDTRYVDLVKLKDQTIVRLEGPAHSHSVLTRYVIGADGAKSRVGRDLGLEENREWIVGVEEVLAGVPLAGPPRFHCFLDPRIAPGYLAWLVHDGEEVHLGVGGYPARFDSLKALQAFRASVSSIVDLRPAKVVERRGGRIPVGGVLRHIANDRGLLVGDAAGAVSPLTAGGLDPCMRLSTFAAGIVGDYLATGDARVLAAYSGELFRARFVSRLWMRRMMSAAQAPALLELGCAVLRMPLINSLAWQVFFGRGSFPDMDLKLAPQRAVSALEITS
jgi:flavin-dependent dehydrogenase